MGVALAHTNSSIWTPDAASDAPVEQANFKVLLVGLGVLMAMSAIGRPQH